LPLLLYATRAAQYSPGKERKQQLIYFCRVDEILQELKIPTSSGAYTIVPGGAKLKEW
jgi:hypothetical protein